MEIDVSRQLFQIGVSWLTGFASGFVYDFFRVLRRKLKASSLFDGLFCLAVLFVLFTLGMSAGGGSLHIFMLAFFCLGFASYMLLLSDVVLTVLNKIAQLISAMLSPAVKLVKKISAVVKKLFSKAGNWFKLRAQKLRKGKAKTVEEDTLHTGDSVDGAGRICYPEPRRRDGRSERGKDGDGGA